MLKDIYNPGKEYWEKVAQLDTILRNRGRRDMSGLLGKIAAVRHTAWVDGEHAYSLQTSRIWWTSGERRWVGSHLCQFEQTDDPPTDSPDAQEDEFAREVVYNPVALGGYAVGDYRYFLSGGLTTRQQAHAVEKAKEEQDSAGFSLPNSETYRFILDSLTVAVRATGQ
jgi:hypothetical protein